MDTKSLGGFDNQFDFIRHHYTHCIESPYGVSGRGKSYWKFLKNGRCSLVLIYKDLHIATKGFKKSDLLGRGDFGKMAVKMVSNDSRQGMREFIAEIATIGRLRHPKLVRLQGYCRHEGELYLVYDCVPKGSLDKLLYHQQTDSLNWSKRLKIIKDVASGLCYLHEQWMEVNTHRDIKPANILLDGNMNAKLGDFFGLAKLYDHGLDPKTSHVAGTFGYISPDLSRTGKASADVFSPQSSNARNYLWTQTHLATSGFYLPLLWNKLEYMLLVVVIEINKDSDSDTLIYWQRDKKASNVVCQGSDPTGGEFDFNGFLYAAGSANLNNNGLFRLTNSTTQTAGQVFYNFPVRFKDSVNGTVYSFSTTFVFAIVSNYGAMKGHGLAFVLCPTRGLSNADPTQYLGLFNRSNDGDPKNHIIAVELDTVKGPEVYDMNANHVGIDINSVISEIAASAGYYKDDGTFIDLLLASGDRMQVWIEYDSKQRQLNVTLHPIRVPKPKIPLLSLQKDLSPFLLEYMYVGFSSSTGSLTASHYILGWTFKMNGTAAAIDPSRLPKVPRFDQPWIQGPKGVLTISLTISGVAILIILGLSLWFFMKRKKLLEVLEDWEVQFGPHRFAFKDLHTATKGFKNTELLGKGGFGKVYKGTLPVSNVEIAVKMVSHDSRQGMREFIAEIATIGRIRHPNLVRLQGYCRHKGELYLVYDCMPKGSLDKFLYDQKTGNLDWSQRFKIIKDVASGLCYLHQQWVQVIIHRDIKPANILLDANMNAKLGDFGLAKLCDHGIDPQTSHVAGTLGYISPELSRTGKASTSSDVFALGVVMLEIACGRKPILPRASQSEMVLTDWVLGCWENGDIMQVLDHKIGQEYVEEQVALVLKLGLLCSHPVPAIRPNMSSVIQFLDSVAQLPDNLLDIVQTREVHRGTEISGGAADSPESSSVAPLTFTESFASHMVGKRFKPIWSRRFLISIENVSLKLILINLQVCKKNVYKIKQYFQEK